MRNRILVLSAFALLPFATAPAQETRPTPHSVLSIQPLNAVFTAYSAEFERAVGAAVTLGVGATYFNVGDGIDEVTYKSADAKLRYYPNGTALMGFSFGVSGGYSGVNAVDFSGNKESASAPSFGVLLEYQWLLGLQRNFAVALGLGAKAIFINGDRFTSSDFVARYPTARVSVGYAF
ncbi:MAG: DUF3575 domain-containing protein [Gemmatimonadales bacterium]